MCSKSRQRPGVLQSSGAFRRPWLARKRWRPSALQDASRRSGIRHSPARLGILCGYPISRGVAIQRLFVRQKEKTWRHRWSPPFHRWRPPSHRWSPPFHRWRPPSHRWRPPSHRWRPPSRRWRPPSRRWRPPFRRWCHPSHRWRPPSHRWRPPSHRWRPPSHRWRPPCYRWSPPFRRWCHPRHRGRPRSAVGVLRPAVGVHHLTVGVPRPTVGVHRFTVRVPHSAVGVHGAPWESSVLPLESTAARGTWFLIARTRHSSPRACSGRGSRHCRSAIASTVWKCGLWGSRCTMLVSTFTKPAFSSISCSSLSEKPSQTSA